jgi:hypothetical protein
MKGFIATIFFLLTVTPSVYAQLGKEQPEVVRDSFGQFAFRELSIELTEDGLQQVNKFGEWYLSNSKDGLYHVFLSGLVTESELQTDSFIGVKRCKVILDSLIKKGVDISFFFITRDKIEGKEEVGVGFVIDTKNRVATEPADEDDYFKGKKKNRKKG